MQEEFKSLRTWNQGQKRHFRYQVIECSRCQNFVNMPVTKDRMLPPEAIVQMMSKKGWVMGHRRKDDICPDCVRKSRKPTLLKIADYLPETSAPVRQEPTQEMKPEEMATMGTVTPLAETGTDPSPIHPREEKRIVLFEIEKRYDDSARCYRGDWSDQKIAEHLNVPLDLVAQLREEFYGLAVDPELLTIKSELAAARSMLTAVQQKVDDLQVRLDAKLKED